MFGAETCGLYDLIGAEAMKDGAICTIPMDANAPIRSLNLSTTVGIALFELYRQRACTEHQSISRTKENYRS